MKRSPMPRKRATARRRPAMRCSWSSRCKRRPNVVIGEDERLCRTHAMQVADKLVGDWVKARDLQCLSCGAIEGLQWAHVISRGARYIRWVPENSMALCGKCHQAYTLRPHTWFVFLERRFPGLQIRMVHLELRGERSGASVDVAEVIRDFRERAAA